MHENILTLKIWAELSKIGGLKVIKIKFCIK